MKECSDKREAIIDLLVGVGKSCMQNKDMSDAIDARLTNLAYFCKDEKEADALMYLVVYAYENTMCKLLEKRKNELVNLSETVILRHLNYGRPWARILANKDEDTERSGK